MYTSIAPNRFCKNIGNLLNWGHKINRTMHDVLNATLIQVDPELPRAEISVAVPANAPVKASLQELVKPAQTANNSYLGINASLADLCHNKNR